MFPEPTLDLADAFAHVHLRKVSSAKSKVNLHLRAMRERFAHASLMNEIIPQSEDQALRSWVTETIAQSGWPISVLAGKAGLAPSTLTRFLNGESASLSPASIERLSSVSAVPMTSSVRKRLDRSDRLVAKQSVNVTRPHAIEIPVWGVHPVGQSEIFRFNPIAIEYLERPSRMSATRKLAAFYAFNDVLSPRWEAGELVIVDLARPAAPGDYALVTLKSPDNPNREEAYCFRRLTGRSNGKLRLSGAVADTADTHNKLTFDLDQVLEVRHVLTWKEIVG